MRNLVSVLIISQEFELDQVIIPHFFLTKDFAQMKRPFISGTISLRFQRGHHLFLRKIMSDTTTDSLGLLSIELLRQSSWVRVQHIPFSIRAISFLWFF